MNTLEYTVRIRHLMKELRQTCGPDLMRAISTANHIDDKALRDLYIEDVVGAWYEKTNEVQAQLNVIKTQLRAEIRAMGAQPQSMNNDAKLHSLHRLYQMATN